jgi:hypothetical protein
MATVLGNCAQMLQFWAASSLNDAFSFCGASTSCRRQNGRSGGRITQKG